jgi:hypothetical protein
MDNQTKEKDFETASSSRPDVPDPILGLFF